MEGKRRTFFNSVAGGWDQGAVPAEESFRRIMASAKIGAGQRILDVGSGTGMFIPRLLDATGGDGEIHALDYAEEMITEIRAKQFPANVVPVLADIHETSYADGFFDRIIANACLPHFRDRVRALREIFRILKPGGIFIVSHARGRAWVNRHHREGPSAIKDDILPPAADLRAVLDEIGFTAVETIDEPEFYLLSSAGPSTDSAGRTI